jgi:hypothetical protein
LSFPAVNEIGLCRLAALAEGLRLIEEKAEERGLVLWNHMWPRCDRCRIGHKCKRCKKRDEKVIGFDGKALCEFVVAKGDAIYQCQHRQS